MNRKRARFDVVSILITVHCPHCDSAAEAPTGPLFTWSEDDIRWAARKDIPCASCSRPFQLHRVLSELLRPSSDPVATDRRVSRVAQVQIVCANCAGDQMTPTLTKLSTDGRCSSCGGENFAVANQLQPDKPNTNGKENSDGTASHTVTAETEGDS